MTKANLETKKAKMDALPNFDVVRYLNSDDVITEYLNQVLEENGDEMLAKALEDIARAKRA